MSNPKILNLSYEELCKIAKALNANILANKSRSKEESIPTDKFLRANFNITRKDYGFTAKTFGIKYNQTTFMYEIPTEVNQVINGSKEVNQPKVLENQEVNSNDTQSTPLNNKESEQPLPISLYEMSQQFNEVLSLTDEVKEMLEWYREHKNKAVIDDTEININNPKLDGEVVTRSYKMYKTVADEFSSFAADRKESIKDLVSLALTEFIEKYKK